jgi:D-3-phosphoglycerate dehydrogenase / 2-oxoglutarate reductase
MYLPHHGHVHESCRIAERPSVEIGLCQSPLLHRLQALSKEQTLIPTMHRILIADPIHEQAQKLLASRPGFEVAVATGLSEAELVQRIPAHDGIIVRSKTRVTASAIAAGQRLKVIGRAGIGVDNIDVAAATERGIVVLNTPDANATTTAELALAHLLSLSRHLPQADRSLRAGEWQPGKFVGTELAGKSVGVIGFGTIGRIFARLCLGLKMHVLAYDPFVTPEIIAQAGAEPVSLDALLARADYVSLHCPLTDQTHHLINAQRLAQMKSGARLINCARGALVDEAALYEALQSGRLAGAALDVFGQEPPKGSSLLALDTVVMTPHLGASTQEAQQAVSVKIAEAVAAYLTTGEAPNAVNLPRIPGEQLIRARPYQHLAHALGGFVAAITPSPITELEIGLYGRAAELDPRPITSHALVGLLAKRLAMTVNQVNAAPLAQRQGITVRETRSDAMHDYIALVELRATTAAGTTSVAGTLLGERLPRLVRIDEYDVEAVPEGHMLFTRHDDRPGVVGALGSILGRENINISRMQVGNANAKSEAIALIGISAALSDKAVAEIQALPPIRQVVQFTL